MIGSACTGRIADRAIALYVGDIEGSLKWLVAMGRTEPTIHRSADQIVVGASVVGISGIRVGLSPSDPIATSQSIALALFGLHWSFVAPGLLALVAARWDAARIARQRSEEIAS